MRTTLCWAVIFLALVHGTVGSQWAKQWATPAQEALDERQDAEILKAVVSSMQEWERKHHSHRRRKRAESQVCYDGLGCFQDSGPFGYLDMLPSKPEEVATRFILYASQSQPALDVPFSNLSQIWPWAEKTFNVSKTTKVIVHGFGSDCDHVWVYEMKSALMAVENCNVICIDWGNGAAVPNYVRASANTRLVGKQLALLLAGLQNRLGLKLEKTHIIGFSLGAHVAGFAGAQLTNLSRITGLDPAGPLFESQDPRARLDSTDAMFVDVIHSNGENLILGGLGSWQPMGHVDFYPNGGRMQKGCSNLFVGAVTDILWSATEVEGRSLCNHRRAYKFFTDSLSPRCHFPAFPCESYEKFLEGGCFPCSGDKRCGNMGYYADKSNVRGTLYLITRDEEPFCAHQYHVRIESAPKVPPAVSYGKIQVTLVGSENINETFSLTQKDDAEIRVGVPLTRIAVPHPALQEPKSVELMYTAYSGWISSGLSQWSIDKLSLTDSFGKSMSVCKKGLMLETGVPVTLPLYPGECNPPRSNITAILIGPPPNKTTSNTSTSSSSSSLLDFFRFKPTPVVQMGDELVGQPPSKIPPDFDPGTTTTTTTGSPSSETTSGPRQPFLGHPPPGSVDLPDKDAILDIAGTASSSTDILDHPPWMPVSYVDSSHTNSLLDKDVHEDSRAFNTEDILVLGVRNRTLNLTDDIKPHLVHAENGTRTIITRSDAVDPVDITLRPEIKEPVLLSTSTRPLPWEADPASLTLNSTFRPRAISLTNDTTITTWRPEIKEPILNPTTPKFKAVKTRHVAAAVAAAANRDADVGDDDWVPKRDLKPPPLGSTWHHWNTKDDAHTSFDEWRRGGSPGGAIGLVSGFGYSHQQQPSGGVATSPIIREMYASPRIDLNVNSDANLVQDDEQDRSNATTLSTTTTSTTPEPSTSSPPPSKRTGRQMLTVQLFPHRLATLLAQAERYARGHFLPYAKQKNKSQTLDDLTAQKTSTVSRKLHVEDATASDNDSGDVAAENGALPPQRRPKYFPDMAESIQNLHLNNPLQLILNIFTSNNHNNNNINKSKVVQDKGRTPDAVRLVQLSKTVGISAKDKPRGELDRDVVYGSALEDASTVKPMEVSKEHVERSVRRDIARAKVLVPYTHDADKENKHKYIPLKDPTGATEAKNTRDIYA